MVEGQTVRLSNSLLSLDDLHRPQKSSASMLCFSAVRFSIEQELVLRVPRQGWSEFSLDRDTKDKRAGLYLAKEVPGAEKKNKS